MTNYVNKRYAYDNTTAAPQMPVEETLEFMPCDISDLRGRVINGEYMLLIGISNPLYEVPVLPYEYETRKRIDPNSGDIVTDNIRVRPILNEEYFLSSYWEPLSLPMLSKYTAITEDQYWIMMSNYRKEYM